VFLFIKQFRCVIIQGLYGRIIGEVGANVKQKKPGDKRREYDQKRVKQRSGGVMGNPNTPSLQYSVLCRAAATLHPVLIMPERRTPLL
jgi:hypothetical protein